MRVRSASLLLAISACVAPLRAAPPSEAGRIDLSTYRMSFDEPFDTLDVSPHGPGTRWTAHTPWNGDFGEARFVDPAADAPFEVKEGKLSITMDRKKGFWRSGLLASMDSKGNGFTQSGGYFEMRAKLPAGNGIWTGFWLGSLGKPGEGTPEIDVVEYYGHDPASYMATVHV